LDIQIINLGAQPYSLTTTVKLYLSDMF